MQSVTLTQTELEKLAKLHFGERGHSQEAVQGFLSKMGQYCSQETPDLNGFEIHKHNPSGICLMDETGKLIQANPAFYKMLEIEPKALVHCNIPDLFVNRQDAVLFRSELDYAKGLFQLSKWKTCTGYVIDVEITGSSVFGYTQLQIRDVTDRVISQIEVHSSLQRYRMLIDVMNEGMAFTDHEGLITYINDQLCDQLGLTKNQIVGKFLTDFLPESLLEFSGKSDTDQERIEVALKVHNNNRWLYLSRKAAYSKAGEYLGAVNVFTDITRMEAARQKVRDANQTLEKEIADRRSAEVKLIKKTSDLERMVQELEKFSYITTHDLQEPLRAIASYVQLLDRRYSNQLDDSAREYIQFAVEGTKRMKRMLQDLLAYISLKAEEDQPMEQYNLAEVIDIAMDNLSEQINESDSVIEIGNMPELTIDAAQMIQYFAHIIHNSIKFRKHCVQNKICIDAQQNGTGWTISVADNGIGFDQVYASKIFQLFQRLHNRERYEGTGIGLAICRKIAQRHRGSIRVNSEEGSGSVFYLELPGELSSIA